MDIATLTGACMIALGDSVAGLFTPSDDMAASLSAAAKQAGQSGCGLGGKPYDLRCPVLVVGGDLPRKGPSEEQACAVLQCRAGARQGLDNPCFAELSPQPLRPVPWNLRRREGVAHAHGGGLCRPAQEVGGPGGATGGRQRGPHVQQCKGQASLPAGRGALAVASPLQAAARGCPATNLAPAPADLADLHPCRPACSSVADIKNTGTRLGGAITAALFPRDFVKPAMGGGGVPAWVWLGWGLVVGGGGRGQGAAALCVWVFGGGQSCAQEQPPGPKAAAWLRAPRAAERGNRPAWVGRRAPSLRRTPPPPVSPQVQWSHIDSAGPAWRDKDGGATGFGAQLLTEWAAAQGR